LRAVGAAKMANPSIREKVQKLVYFSLYWAKSIAVITASLHITRSRLSTPRNSGWDSIGTKWLDAF